VKKALLALVAVACVVPALALAATPKKDSSYAYCPTANKCPLNFNTSANGHKIKNLSMYNDCAEVPPKNGYPSIRIKDTGKFKKSGTVTDFTGAELTFTIKGKFKKPKKAVGTYEIDSSKSARPCDSDPKEFVAKWKGEVQ
jgi:hypothetical protein